ncbi:hypothetical protein EYF80_035406 [Liparis tanakae]|uniref:Uncharacterized protein n=1 Tax=Liparis tanakae TaxID=230148 RepID=A0A4Z2GLC2_9TELE|nr:hypothetical protein EYF80_035406 [Liparis tanakae]
MSAIFEGLIGSLGTAQRRLGSGPRARRYARFYGPRISIRSGRRFNLSDNVRLLKSGLGSEPGRAEICAFAVATSEIVQVDAHQSQLPAPFDELIWLHHQPLRGSKWKTGSGRGGSWIWRYSTIAGARKGLTASDTATL